MKKKLLIVESPAKIKTIGKFLGKDYKIMSTVGHIKDLPKKNIGIHLNDSIELEYVVLQDKEKVIADICKQAQTADEIFLAPDPDREGEIIAWHIGKEIENVIDDPKKIHRITFHEITKPAVTEAIDHPQEIDMQKVAAQQARRVLDRWVGYEVSPILWRKIAKGLSAGRVQSVALKLICEREDAIRKFKPQEFWSIDGLFVTPKNSTFSAGLTHISNKKINLKNEKETQAIVKEIKKESYHIASIKDKQQSKKPAAPFMTSSLQQAAYTKLGFSVKKTMQIAQNLYEGIPLNDPQNPIALITYMRTDSPRISNTAIQQVRSYIKDAIDTKYLPKTAHSYTKKSKSQDAHEAIRPINVELTPDQVKKFATRDQARLYELIWKRFVACQMKPALYAQRQIEIQGGKFIFKVTGSTLIFDGFLKVYRTEEDEKEKETTLPRDLQEKEPLTLKKLEPKQHFTQPPARFTEASLVKELEKESIGRPSTYATILTTIRARQYTMLDEKKKFVPTELGFIVTKMLTKNLPNIMDTKFTAHMEANLDKIAEGKLDRDVLLRNFYTNFEKNLEAFREKKTKKNIELEMKCPDCKKNNLTIRIGKTGEFIGCTGYPDCSFTSNFTRLEDGTIKLIATQTQELLDEKCPQCGKQLRRIIGKFGPFIACSGYPECKYIKQKKASFPCPLDKGDVLEKRWKGKTFWGCSNYPNCKFSIFGDIEEIPCPQCNAPFLTKRTLKDRIILQCHNTECKYIIEKEPAEA